MISLATKNTSGLKYKDFGIVPDSIKVDDSSRIVEGYFSSFNVIDSDADKIMPGAFEKSIAEHGPSSAGNRKIAHLAHHDMRRPVGKLVDLKEDQFGLFFRSRMGSHADGDDSLKMYKDGIITEHSIGFNYIPDMIKYVEHSLRPEMSHFEIHEVKLWEGSHVTFGANSETPNNSAVKSIEDRDNRITELHERQEKFLRALVDGSYSQKFNNFAEYELRQIFKELEDLARWEPSEDPKEALRKSNQGKKDEDSIDSDLFNSINL